MRQITLLLTLVIMLYANFPGGVVTIDLGIRSDEPIIYFEGKRVRVIKSQNDKYIAQIGIPLDAKGKKSLQIEEMGKSKITTVFSIGSKAYPVQKIYIDEDKFVHPNSSELERIKQEREIMQKHIQIYSSFAKPLDLMPPIKGRLSGAFGRERFFNDEPRAPHAGADIAAPKGTKVAAAQSGKVILTGEFFYCGKFVLLDHGKGFMTLYCHLNNFNVQKSQMVTKGEFIAEVGSTGRATGPHLHFSAILNGVFIDPLLLFEPAYSKHSQTKARPK